MKLVTLWLWIGAAIIASALIPKLSFSQDAPPAPVPDPVAAAPVPPAEPKADTAAPVVERNVYLPYKDLKEVFEKDGRGVFLPYREFLDLWNQLQVEQEEKKVAPPADGILSSAQYTASVDGDVVKFVAALQVESFKDGWAVLPLIKSGLNIAEAETGKATLRLGNAGYELLLPEKGVYDLKLTIYSPITRGAGKNSTRLSLPKTAVSRFEMLVPGRGWEFEIKPGTAFTTKPAGDADTALTFFTGEGTCDVSWQKQGEATKLTALIFAEVDTSSTAIPGALQSTAKLNYRILRAGVDSFEIGVPAPHEVLSVSGENIREWDIGEADAAGIQKLKVTLHAPAKDQYVLNLGFEAGLDQLPISIKPPVLSVAGVLRQRGSVSLAASPELEVELKDVSGLAQQAQSLAAGQGIIGRYRYLRLPYDITLDIKQAEPVVEVQSYTTLTVEPDTMNYRATFDYEVKRVGIFGTRIQIPGGFESVEATGDGVEDFAEVEEDGVTMLDVKFKSQSSGKFRFQLTGRKVRDGAEDDVSVPVFHPQAVTRHEGKVGLAIHTSLDPNTKEIGDLRQEDVSQLRTNVLFATADELLPITLGFRYRGEAKPATVSFKQKTPQISTEVLISVEVREQLLRYEWTIGYSILYAGVDTFIIAVPTDHSAALREKGEIIKEIVKDYTPDEDEIKAAAKALGLADGQTPADNGFKFWKLVLRDKKMGNYPFTLSLEVPTKSLEAGKQSSVTLPEIAPIDVFQESGQLAVVKEGNLEISEAKAENLEEIDPTELRGRLRRAGVFLAYKYKQHPLDLELRVSKNQFLPVPEAVVVDAIVNTAVSTDRGITSEVIYWVRNNSKQFFSIRLPEGGEMLADIYVNGESRQPMRRAEDKDEILVRLPAGGNTGGEFPIRFVYSVPSPDAGKKLGRKGSIDIAPVTVDANIIRSQLNLYLPDDYHYTNFEGAMWEPVTARGWSTQYKNLFSWMVPALGPDTEERGVAHWDERAEPGSGKAGFDHPVPREGQHIILRRLGAPDAVHASFLSKGYSYTIQAFAFILALGVGLLLLRLGFVTKVFYFIAVGLGSLVVGGAIYPRSQAFCHWIFIGVAVAAAIWLLVAVGRLLGGCCKKKPSPDPDPDPEDEDEEPEEEKKPEAAKESDEKKPEEKQD